MAADVAGRGRSEALIPGSVVAMTRYRRVRGAAEEPLWAPGSVPSGMAVYARATPSPRSTPTPTSTRRPPSSATSDRGRIDDWPQAVLRGDYGPITVGARTSIQDGAVIHCTAEHSTVIGDDCVIGHLAHLEGCTVEDGALVGTGSIVLHRVVVRTAPSWVRARWSRGLEVPSGAMALGVPARSGPIRDPRPDPAARGELPGNAARYRAELRRID